MSFSQGSCSYAVDAEFQKVLMNFYAYDSYDLTAAMTRDGQRLPDDESKLPGFWMAYSVDWTGLGLINGDLRKDAPNQLKLPSAPPDKTVLTMCNYHVTTAHGDKCPVMLITGTVKPLDYKQVLEKGWNIYGN